MDKAVIKEPIIIPPSETKNDLFHVNSAKGQSFVIHEWSGSGPDYLHVHYEDDEAWYVLKGTIQFTFSKKLIEAVEGTLVFVPAGVPHTYSADDAAKYLMILTPRLDALISELHNTPYNMHADLMKKYSSEILTKA